MIQALLDTDTLSLFHKRHPKIVRRAAQHVRQYGYLIFSELSYYEVTHGLKAINATTQLAQFEQFCQSHRILPFSHKAAVMAADIWSDLKRRGSLIGEVDTLIAGVALSE